MSTRSCRRGRGAAPPPRAAARGDAALSASNPAATPSRSRSLTRADALDRRGREAIDAGRGADDRARQRRDRVGVAAEPRGGQARLPRVLRVPGGDRERGGHGLLRRHAGPHQLVDVVERIQPDRPLDTARDVGARDVGRVARATARGLDAGGERRPRCRRRRRPRTRRPRQRRPRRRRRSCRASGGSCARRARATARAGAAGSRCRPGRSASRRRWYPPPAGVLDVARGEALERTPRRRAEEIERAGVGHPLLPGEQGVRRARADRTSPSPSISARATISAWSVSSVTRPAGRPALISFSGGPGSKPVERAEQRGDPLARERLGRHPQGVADRQPVERTERPRLAHAPALDRADGELFVDLARQAADAYRTDAPAVP